ncbi:uncharacterized protein [Lepeophtheirus salmonis]|uniref:uncharacterized protein n=1 Tax=Lepeophtheirus salmonis TaxID=72036 RepID=UPI001AE0EB05|nr:zinc finger protein 286A-like [Lepeophtheirus salmonis]
MGGISVETKIFRCDRLVSYLELSGTELGNCLYCDKSTNHDHDIFGKIKFHPKDLKIFISLVVSDKRCDSGLEDNEQQLSLNISKDPKNSKEDKEYEEDMNNLLAILKSGVLNASIDQKIVTSTFKSKDFVYEITIPPSKLNTSEIRIQEDPPLYFSSIQQHFSTKYGVEFRAENESRCVSKPQCNICLQLFKDEVGLRKHYALHNKVKERRFECQICKKRFIKLNHLQSHELLHTGVKPFECRTCPKKYSSEFALKNHRIHTHDEGDKPKCDECGKTFFTNSGVRKHVLRFHNKDLRLYCNECPRIYLRKDNLERHVRLVHRDPKGMSMHQSSESKIQKKSSSESFKSAPSRYPTTDPEEVIDGLFGEDSNNTLHRKGEVLNISGGLDASATEALLKNLTPQPDYLLKNLTPIPLEALEEMFLGTN